MSIDIEADGSQEYVTFDTKKEIRALLMESGLWCLIKQRPYDCIALPHKSPRAIFVSTFDTAPLAPDYEWVVKGENAALQAAVTALSKVAPVYVGVRAGAAATDFRNLKDCTHFEVAGVHPAGNVGVQINHVLPMRKGDTVWTVKVQDMLIIGRLLLTGKVDKRKKVALTGPMARTKQYYTVLEGMPIESFTRGNIYREAAYRIIRGNALSGVQADEQEVVSIYDNQYTVIAEGTETHEFMGWIMPRFNTFHFGKTDPAAMMDNRFMSTWFGKSEYKWDARLKGGRRAIIVSGEYEKVFPMDIYPEQLIKAMIAGNLDKMEQLGACEVAPEDFALCEYVCTSKMPLQAIVREALDNMKNQIE